MDATANDRSEIARVFNDSLDRCLHRPDFLERFYELFLAADPRVAERFQNTDFTRQKRMLTASLYMMMLMEDDRPRDLGAMESLARRHGPGELEISPDLYELWLDCLLQAVRECDPQWSRRVEEIWRSTMIPGMQFMMRFAQQSEGSDQS